MTAKEFVQQFRAKFEGSPIGAAEALGVAQIFSQFLAEEIYGARLANGSGLRDIMDCRQYISALAVAAEIEQKMMNAPPRLELQQRKPAALATCPDCGHVHADDRECGFPTGGDRKCLCDRKVLA